MVTPQERASKFSDRDFKTMFDWRLRELIAAEIKEAVNEEHNNRADANRVIDWIGEKGRKPAVLAFTEGPERQIASAVEKAVEEATEEALKVRSCDDCKLEGFNLAKEMAANECEELSEGAAIIGADNSFNQSVKNYVGKHMPTNIRALQMPEDK